jgi:hypothetical protein
MSKNPGETCRPSALMIFTVFGTSIFPVDTFRMIPFSIKMLTDLPLWGEEGSTTFADFMSNCISSGKDRIFFGLWALIQLGYGFAVFL